MTAAHGPPDTASGGKITDSLRKARQSVVLRNRIERRDCKGSITASTVLPKKDLNRGCIRPDNWNSTLTKLSVNLNKVALVRNTRTRGIPDVAHAGAMVLAAGADGLTVHPRPDLRHITPADVRRLGPLCLQHGVEYNIEGNPFAAAGDNYPGFMALIREMRPAQCTLVPDSPTQATSDHGWTFPDDSQRLAPIIADLRALGIRTALFMDPLTHMMPYVRDLGCDRIELYTGPYAEAFGTDDQDSVLERYILAAQAARDAGLGVNAGHDLDLHNLATLLAAIPVDEVSIGHAFTADALHMGLTGAVRAYLGVIASVRRQPAQT